MYLRKKVTTRRLYPELFALSLEDVALDCIADFFQQGESGSLVQVQAYFEGLEYRNATDEELLTHVRRLTFSKVNQGLFRLYNEIDPGLGKILRNIKLSIHSLQNFIVLERFGEQCVMPAMCDSLEHLPPISRDDLRHALLHEARGVENIPTLLSHLSKFLRDQSKNSRIVSIMEIAFAIKSVYASDNVPEEIAPEDRFTNQDTLSIIKDICCVVRKEMTPVYVGKKTVTSEMFEKYFLVIQQNLEARIIGHDGELISFYDRLHVFAPEVSREEYQRHHKSKLEYLGRLTHTRVIAELRKQL